MPRPFDDGGAGTAAASGSPGAVPAVATVSPWCAMAVMVVEPPHRPASGHRRAGRDPPCAEGAGVPSSRCGHTVDEPGPDPAPGPPGPSGPGSPTVADGDDTPSPATVAVAEGTPPSI